MCLPAFIRERPGEKLFPWGEGKAVIKAKDEPKPTKAKNNVAKEVSWDMGTHTPQSLGVDFGILIAFISNALLAKFLGDKAWRWMIGIEAFPAVFYTLLVWIIPKSPRWLISKNNDIEGAKSIFSMLYHNKDTIEKQVALIVASNKKVYDRESIFSKIYIILLNIVAKI